MYAPLGALAASPSRQELEAQWSKLYDQLRGLSHSIAAERERGNAAGVKAMLPIFRETIRKMNDLNRQLYNAEFTAFDKFLLATDDWVSKAIAAIPNAIAAVPSAVGQGLIKAAIPFAILGVGLFFLKDKLGKFRA